jgi:hypothetical protein
VAGVARVAYLYASAPQWQNSWFHADIGISENEISRIMVFGFFEETGRWGMVQKVFCIAFRVFLDPQKAKKPRFSDKNAIFDS